MKIKHASNDPQSMAQDGDSILKSLQNQNLPIIDLIIREAIQNSLDATLPKKEETLFDLTLDNFMTSRLSPHFEGISEKLEKKYPGKNKFLAFSDKNTSGLTGIYDTNDHNLLRKSNFQKLIFDIGKNQEQEGAGGSWGLGKTSYFRSGIGLVIYYTRIQTKTGFEERLVGSLIESPKSKQRLLAENPRGIAWWGEYGENKDIILPITNTDEIESLLDVFSLKRYENEETGTTIIIPYFHSQDKIDLSNEERYYWEEDDEIAIKYAVQRWYMPRLRNPKYRKITGNSVLRCTVNGVEILPSMNTEVTFDIFRELYDAALTGEASAKWKDKIKISPIAFKRLITQKSEDLAGRVAYCEVSKEDLLMTPPNNKKSGLSYLGIKDSMITDSFKAKVMAFSRKPGMIVRYSVDDDWLPKGTIQNDDRLIFAFFVPVSQVILHNKLQNNGYKTMETYLRAIENADHASWEDRDGINIITRTKAEITRAVQDEFKKEEKSKDGNVTASLARKYGQLFVPLAQGKASTTRKTRQNTTKKNTAVKRATIQVDSTQTIKEGNIIVRATVSLPKKSLSLISVKLDSQEKVIDKDQWQTLMGNKAQYPIVIKQFAMEKTPGTDSKSDDNYITIENNLNDSIEIKVALNLAFDTMDYLPLLSIKSEKLIADEEMKPNGE